MTSPQNDMNRLGIFAKYWQPGQVKTRLGASVGMPDAARVYQAMLFNLTERLGSLDTARELSIWPEEKQADFLCFSPAWTVTVQADGNLGNKMHHFFQSAFAAGAERAILIGSDCPLLTKTALAEAFDRVSKHDVVLGPSEDGGYYLIGGTPAMPDLFSQMSWSTSQVWPDTVARLTERKTTWAQLETRSDVDDVSDLRSLQHTLATAAYQSEEWRGLRTCVESIDLGDV